MTALSPISPQLGTPPRSSDLSSATQFCNCLVPSCPSPVDGGVSRASEMGLLSIIRKIKRKEKEMRILMVGLDNSGKTTIVLKINGEDTSVISPTLGFNIKTIKYHKYSLNIWDVGGQKTIRSYWRNYFEQTDGLVWVVDSSDIRRLDDCRAELHNLLKEERLAGASLLVFANKQDIQGALKPSEIAKLLLGPTSTAARNSAALSHLDSATSVRYASSRVRYASTRGHVSKYFGLASPGNTGIG
uniref:ADP-ribosylation factor-like protein 2 n=1 Tax=Leersia perrieri TaxID=77586 RepID=A0A0D9W999_9ORYZ